MLFNSIEFALFLPIVFILHWFLFNKTVMRQNILLLISSYFFYGVWDVRFLALLFFSTVLDYVTGIKIHEASTRSSKKFWFWLSIGANLGFLGFFKYYNFFVASFAELLASAGVQANPWTLQIILPVGISFYTFHGMSYVIDVYYDRIKPTRNFPDYALFVSFFPLLVAGPIERATHLLPQLEKKRNFDFDKATDGLRQILWGLFKKIVIADNCATYVNQIFSNPETASGSTLLLGAIFFAFQIYGDFSGYSDIALGTAKLFGIDLLRNFSFPYFSRDIAEFWRRWHMSLTTWFRDYVYIPLGGSRVVLSKKIRNTFVIFIISGFWHGANWTFIVWGLLHALYFIPLLITGKNRSNLDMAANNRTLPSPKEFARMLFTFLLVSLAWIFFRAETVGQAFEIIQKIGSPGLFEIPSYLFTSPTLFIPLMLIIEWFSRHKLHPLQFESGVTSRPVRWAIYYMIIATVFLFGGQQAEFIYFQF